MNYHHIDHTHCWEEENPPCGQKIEHYKCCLCEMVNPKCKCMDTQHTEQWRSEVAALRKSQEFCSCGGRLVKAYGTGAVSFPLQCKKCGGYTDYTANGYNDALEDVLPIIEQAVQSAKREAYKGGYKQGHFDGSMNAPFDNTPYSPAFPNNPNQP